MAVFLTKEEELSLGVQIQEMLKAKEEINDNIDPQSLRYLEIQKKISLGESAVEKLVEAHIPLVHRRAQIFKSRLPSSPDLEDLVQEGMTGLMKAVYKFDPSRGNKFTTVAYHWIIQAIGRGTNSTGRLVRLPENRVEDYINIKKAQEAFRELNVSPAEIDNRVMAELKLTKAEYMDINNAANSPASLNKVISDSDGSSKELIDYVGQLQTEQSSEDKCIQSELISTMKLALADLTEVERDVVSSSFMLDFDSEPLKPKEIRERHKLTSQKFNKILTEALNKVRVTFDSKGLSSVDFLN